ncbi:MAG: methylmalonyl-CoA mutase, partial [Proteobacteria bacterium]|nr:methylmalonyl-CoA mutase [Pseudomonadota bacterium]
LRQHKARADFSTGFLQPGGFEVLTSDGFNAIEDAAAAAVVSKANIVVICSTDDTYPDLVPSLTKLIKEQRSDKYVLVAGYPVDCIDDFRSAGVDDFIHLKADNLSLLQKLQSKAGVSS